MNKTFVLNDKEVKIIRDSLSDDIQNKTDYLDTNNFVDNQKKEQKIVELEDTKQVIKKFR